MRPRHRLVVCGQSLTPLSLSPLVDQLNSFASEVTRVAREVGTEGKLGGQAQVKGVGGVWKDLTDNVNTMAGATPPRQTRLSVISLTFFSRS